MSKAEIEIAPGRNTRLTAEASGYYSREAELLFSNLPDSGIIIEAQLLVLSGDTLIANFLLHSTNRFPLTIRQWTSVHIFI